MFRSWVSLVEWSITGWSSYKRALILPPCPHNNRLVCQGVPIMNICWANCWWGAADGYCSKPNSCIWGPEKWHPAPSFSDLGAGNHHPLMFPDQYPQNSRLECPIAPNPPDAPTSTLPPVDFTLPSQCSSALWWATHPPSSTLDVFLRRLQL